ncbi:MAG TPA: ABC transporter ATP-binding protein [Bacilli bacterium]|nr:ABC transporter ATP-binding protein [Bacilli bacterium]
MMPLAIKMENICKVYDNGYLANDDITFELKKGEIHAIAGENGAGKSTLMKILYGAETPTSGKIFVSGEEVKILSPAHSIKEGIGMVFQHFMLVDEMTVIENIFLGVEQTKLNVLLKKDMEKKLQQLSEQFNIRVPFHELCGNLSVSQKQKVEILKVLSKSARVLIFDEPTAVLTAPESDELFAQLRLLRDAGHTIVIITHKLDEIKQLCDRVTILRQGKSVGTYDVKQLTVEEISRLMVGFEINLFGQKKAEKVSDKTLLNVSELLIDPAKDVPINFTVNAGEIVCFTGVEGSGQDKVIEIITGIQPYLGGEIFLGEKRITNLSVKEIRASGVSYIPANRMELGVNLETSVFENLSALKIGNTSKKQIGFYNKRQLTKEALIEREQYRIKTSAINQQIELLSGGNIQKVVAAREIETKPKLLIAEHPTRGVDVGTMELIFAKMRALKKAGTSILLVSTDWNEMLALADRILIFYNGEITAEINDLTAIDEYELGYYMLGVKKMERPQ